MAKKKLTVLEDKKVQKKFQDMTYDYVLTILNKKQKKQVTEFICKKAIELMVAQLVFDELVGVTKAWDNVFGKEKQKKGE